MSIKLAQKGFLIIRDFNDSCIFFLIKRTNFNTLWAEEKTRLKSGNKRLSKESNMSHSLENFDLFGETDTFVVYSMFALSVCRHCLLDRLDCSVLTVVTKIIV